MTLEQAHNDPTGVVSPVDSIPRTAIETATFSLG